MSIDHSILLFFYGLASGGAVLAGTATILAEWLVFFIPAIVAIGFVVKPNKRHLYMLLGVLAAGVIGYVLAEILKLIVDQSRPFLELDFRPLISSASGVRSFPSGHATMAFSMSTLVIIMEKRLGILLTIFSFLVGIGRIAVGVHWPSDVAAGAVLGVIIGWVVFTTLRRYVKLA